MKDGRNVKGAGAEMTGPTDEQLQRGEGRRKNSKYAERRKHTWGSIEAILVDKRYGVKQCIKGKYKVVSKLIRVIANDTGEPMASPDDVPLFMPDNRNGKGRREND